MKALLLWRVSAAIIPLVAAAETSSSGIDLDNIASALRVQSNSFMREEPAPVDGFIATTSNAIVEPKPGNPADPVQYLNAALDLMQQNSLNRRSIDWDSLRRQALDRARGAATLDDTYLAIVWALLQLKDCHSFFMPPASLPAARRQALDRGVENLYHQYRAQCPNLQPSPYLSRSSPEGHIDAPGTWRVGHVVVPMCDFSDAEKYGAELAGVVARLAGKEPNAWIIDLRGNGGGDMWPMLAGIGPVLGEGLAGAFVDADGRAFPWGYYGGKAGAADGEYGFSVPSPISPLSPAPVVAVLIDRGTTSSGEAVAVAFHGRMKTRFFGEHTYGLSSANNSYVLSDGGMLLVTVAVDQDRLGIDYPHGIEPDVSAPSGDASIPPEAQDAAVAAAERWFEGILAPGP